MQKVVIIGASGRVREIDVICGVGAPELRFRLVERARALGARFCNAIGAIAPGRVAAQRLTWQGTVRGEPAVTARVN